MAPARTLLLILAIIILTFSTLLSSKVDAGAVDLSNWILTPGGSCNGSMGDCLDDEDEFALDNEINHRILANKRYISYGALKRNNVPCSRRGASYYNCRPGASANPYRRGCSQITRCRS